LQNIDNAQVMIADHYENAYEFGVSEVLIDAKNTYEAIEILKKNSIIILNDIEKIREYEELSKVLEELTATHSRYFERRNKTSVGWKNISAVKRHISDFWKKTTENNTFSVRSIDFNENEVSLLIQHDCKFNPSQFVNHEQPIHVIGDLADQMFSRVKTDNLISGYKSKVVGLQIYANIQLNEIIGVEHILTYPYADKEGVEFRITDNETITNQVHWLLRFDIPYREFMNRIAQYHNDRIKS
jgi:hypothetical protein